MKFNRLYIAAALLGTVLAACQRVQEEQLPDDNSQTERVWTLTVNATKDAETRVLSLNGTALEAAWAEGEKVDVFRNGALLGTLTAESDGTNATLSGPIDGENLDKDDVLTLVFPGREGENYNWTYIGQDGALPSEFDYALAMVTVDEKDSNTMAITLKEETVPFANQQSVYRFTLQNGNYTVSGEPITISSKQNKLVRSMTLDGDATYGLLNITPISNSTETQYYMAIRNEYNEGDDTYFFHYIDEYSALCEGSKTIQKKHLSTNEGKLITKFLGGTVNMSKKKLEQQNTTVATAL